MEAPLCKVCDPPRRHWSNEPHHVNERPAKRSGDTLVADKAVPRPAPVPAKESARAKLLRVSKERIIATPRPKKQERGVLVRDFIVPGSTTITTNRPEMVELTSRGTPRQRAPKGTFDRKAYQREKARERRARQAKDKPNGHQGTD